jgi:hypothetical protein
MKKTKITKINERGQTFVIVLIVLAVLLLAVTYFHRLYTSSQKGEKAQVNYVVNSDRAEATFGLAKAWLMNFNSPPEWDAKDVEGCTNCYPQIRRNAMESDIKNMDDDDFYSLDEDNRYMILAKGISPTANCTSNDGYSVNCWRTHTYLLFARSGTGQQHRVQQISEFKRVFYY